MTLAVRTLQAQRPQRVAILGGGFSGAAVALHLADAIPARSVEIVVFEPRAELGRGLAYDSLDPAHRINVPAARMSLFPDRPMDFEEWLSEQDAVANDPAARRPDGSLFPQRRIFGAYVASRLKPHLDADRIVHRRTMVAGVRRSGDGWVITDEHGDETLADFVVIATTHPAPQPPRHLQARLAGHPRYVADPTLPNALAAIRPDDRVLIVGNGLTAADVVASLVLTGYRGSILSLSRRGLRSRGHALEPQEPFGDFAISPAKSAAALLHHVRRTLTQAETAGIGWHAVLDQVRAQGRTIWQALPIVERCRIVRHLRPFWDAHRFRVAPQVEDVLDRAIAENRLKILAGSIQDVTRDGDDILATSRPRGCAFQTARFDAVVVTTGPAHGAILNSQPWLIQLARDGWLTADPAGLGIACNEQSEALGRGRAAEATLLIAGPLARGTFGELMGLPQVSEHAVFVAGQLQSKLVAHQICKP